MAPDPPSPKLLILVAGVFLLLAVVHLWFGDQETEEEPSGKHPRLSHIEIQKTEEQVEINPEESSGDLATLVESRIYLLRNGETNERRATAIQLAFLTTEPARRRQVAHMPPRARGRLRKALLTGLNDSDAVVSENCREALVGLWRIADSVAVAGQFTDGLAAYRSGHLQKALDSFRNAERLRGSVPPDLYRIKAKIHLAQGDPDAALEECKRALDAEPLNFMALLVVARIHARQDNYEKALSALDAALKIHNRFEEARKMRRRIAGLDEEAA